MLLIAAAISGYTAVDLNMSLTSRTQPLDAQASNHVGGVTLARDSTIIKPMSVPTAALPNRKPIRYTVRQGDSLESVGLRYGLALRDITWSNPGLRLPLKPGQVLDLPPMPGVVVLVKAGDTAGSLAAKYGVDPTELLGFNDLRPSQLAPGLKLVVPLDLKTSPNLSNGAPADPISPGHLFCPIKGAPIIQKFGPTDFAVEPSYGGYLHFHTGVDLLAEYGTPIDAAAGGKVTATGYADYYGIRVQITDSYGLVEIYAHMESVSVNVGDLIQQGQPIGHVGSTGLSIGSHLHLQLEIGGVPADPLPLAGC